jgi:hypothetical protein
MHYRRITVTAILSAALLAGPAALAAVPANASTNQSMCDNTSSSTPCLNDENGGSAGGNAIIMFRQDSDDSQNIQYKLVGYVGTDGYDPFTDDNLDNTYHGDAVVEIWFENVGSSPTNGCAGLTNNGSGGFNTGVVLESCKAEAVDSLWILAPPAAGSSSTYCSAVNQGATNTSAGSSEVMVLTGGNGVQATVSQWNNSATQRWEWGGISNIEPYCTS